MGGNLLEVIDQVWEIWKRSSRLIGTLISSASFFLNFLDVIWMWWYKGYILNLLRAGAMRFKFVQAGHFGFVP